MTLVELLAVIVILAIVGAIAFVAIGNVIENSKKDAHVANALQVIAAAKLYEASEGELDSVDIDKLDTIGELIDPWTKEEYSFLEQDNVDVNVSKSKVEGEDQYEYKITNFDADDDKCDLTATEAELRKDGRGRCGVESGKDLD